MNGNPILYILGLTSKKLNNNENDLYVKDLFLAIRGLYINHGYEYGSGWLYLPIPEDIFNRINILCETLQNEEKELSESLAVPDDFDMKAKGFQATEDIVKRVMKMRKCEEIEAKRFVALGIHLELNFSDLDATFEESGDCLYVANGTEYYIGTEDELTEIAKDIVDDDEYEYLWRESVAAKSTTLGLKEWRESIIKYDGWCSVINGYDGRHSEYNIAGESICVSRT